MNRKQLSFIHRSAFIVSTSSLLLSAEHAAKLRRVRRVAGEDPLEVGVAEMLLGDFAEHVAEVGRQSEVAPVVEFVGVESRPLAVNFPAARRAADDEHGVGVAVVGAAVAVLSCRAPELRHREDHHVVHARAEVCVEGVDAARKFRQTRRELAARAALVDMRVPTAHVRERHFEADARFDELRDLQESVAELRARILRAVLRLVLRRIDLLQKGDSLERLLARAAEGVARRLFVDVLEAALHRLRSLPGANREVREIRDGERGRASLHRARQVLRHRDTAKRRLAGITARLQVTIQPAVGRGLDAGRARFHVVLRVEVRARAVGRSGGMDDGETLRIPHRLEPGERRMQAEETVEVDDRLARRALARLRNGNRRAHGVIIFLAVRHHDVEAVGRAALEDGDQSFPPPARVRLQPLSRRHPLQKRGRPANQPDARKRDASRL